MIDAKAAWTDELNNIVTVSVIQMFYKIISFKYVGVCYIVSIEVILLCLYYLSVIFIYNFFINKSKSSALCRDAFL